jgi:carbonic anhydrase
MEINKIFENNEKWIARKLDKDPDYFKNLDKGQSPEILYIGCSDSRVPAESVMGAEPGDIFVHRNVANVVTSTDLNLMSVLNYAVVHLKVKHVVVCGHYSCGGVKAAMGSADLGILNPWIRKIKDVARLHKDELNGIANEDDKYNRLVELNVQEQCINLIKTPEVQNAQGSSGIQIHGWVFDISKGKLIDLNIDFDKEMEGIKSIYKLD